MITPANDAPPPIPAYNLLDLKYQIVEAVQAHIPVPKQDTVSFLLLFSSYRIICIVTFTIIIYLLST
jgi:hypothetical protein